MKKQARADSRKKCEACQRRPVQRPRERYRTMCDSERFRLCHPCEERMGELSLRPLEWYRLALRYGPHLSPLSDEYYSDGGIALWSDHELEEEPDLLRAPVLADMRADLGKLWQHTLTRRQLKPKLLAAWRAHPKAAVAAFLQKTWQMRKDSRARGLLLQLCAECLGHAGAALVRRAWADYARARPKLRKARVQPPDDEDGDFSALMDKYLGKIDASNRDDEDDDWLSTSRRELAGKPKRSAADEDDEKAFTMVPELDREDISVDDLAFASALCLPAAEGFEHVRAVLETVPPGRRHQHLHLLAHFKGPRTLGWIETHVERPVTEEWGRLAALSGLDWARVVAWLEKGRPMGHVALDALRYLIFTCGDPADDHHGVRLLHPPSRKTLCQVLLAHARRDKAPRVRKRVDFVLSHPAVLLEGKPYE